MGTEKLTKELIKSGNMTSPSWSHMNQWQYNKFMAVLGKTYIPSLNAWVDLRKSGMFA